MGFGWWSLGRVLLYFVETGVLDLVEIQDRSLEVRFTEGLYGCPGIHGGDTPPQGHDTLSFCIPRSWTLVSA